MRWGVAVLMIAILGMSTAIRVLPLGLDSFWYDEVVTMRLARASSPSRLMTLLHEIDATRAPLHPMVLAVWLRVFGTTEFAARGLSALFGVLTVAILFPIGRRIGSTSTGVWASAMAMGSPLLVEYSQEARMYAMLAFVACAGWWCLLSLRDGISRRRIVAYAACLVAMVYTHPLGLLMAATLALAAIGDRKRSGMTLKTWAIVHLCAGLAVAPWLPRYLDHPPEFTTGRLPIRFLLGTPIGFTGGDSRTLVLFVVIVIVGLIPQKIRGLTNRDAGPSAWPIVLWLVLPPTLLYAYSWAVHPIFGPSRYNLYVAPAFLLLVARGLSRMTLPVQTVMGYAIPSWMLATTVVSFADRPPKADWYAAAQYLADEQAPVIVISPSTGRNFEVEVARYYLGNTRTVLPMTGTDLSDTLSALGTDSGRVYLSVSLRDGDPVGSVPELLRQESRHVRHVNFRGLRLMQIVHGP